MQHLVGILNALDPEASESLKVVAYFDGLITRGVGVDGLVRGAALLSGAIAGSEVRGRVTRRAPDGRVPPEVARTPRALLRSGTNWSAWLERDGSPLRNDAMIVERLALALELLERRRLPETGLDVVIDATQPPDARARAMARLNLEPDFRVRLLATRDEPLNAPSTVTPTQHGLLRASLDTTGTLRPQGLAGYGHWVRADRAADSWNAATIAVRLADDTNPVVDATDLGAMLLLAQAYDPAEPPEDVRVLAKLDTRSAEILRALVEEDSMRAVTNRLSMHHSSVQARHEAFTRELGYDPRSAVGRMRYIAAALLLRLTDPNRLLGGFGGH